MTAYNTTLDTSGTGTPALTRDPAKVLSCTGADTPTLKRDPTIIRKATATGTPTLKRDPSIVRRVTSTCIPSKTVLASVTYSVSSTATASVQLTVEKVLDCLGSLIGLLSKNRKGASTFSYALAERKWSVDFEAPRYSIMYVPRFTYLTLGE